MEVKTKGAVSSGYIEDCLNKYGNVTNRSTEDSNVVVLGAVEGNIGGIIAGALDAEEYKSVTEWDRADGDLIQRQPKLSELYKDTDCLIMCQGTTMINWIENQTDYSIAKQINDSLVSHIIQTNEFVKQSIDRPYRKVIIYVGSMAYRSVLNGSSVYCAAKAGLNMFARCMAWELAPKGYDVYVIHPGNVKDSPMTRSTIKQLAEYRGLTPLEAELYWNTGNPRNTILTPYNIAELVCQLCRGTLQYCAGNPIDLTGGQR